MDKTKMGVLGAITSIALPAAAGAVPTEPAVAPAQSYADLLQPIPNAVEKLQVADAQEAAGLHGGQLIKAQYYHHHHHHHHHAHYYRRYYGGSYYNYNRYYYRHRHYYHHHHHHHYRYY